MSLKRLVKWRIMSPLRPHETKANHFVYILPRVWTLRSSLCSFGLSGCRRRQGQGLPPEGHGWGGYSPGAIATTVYRRLGVCILIIQTEKNMRVCERESHSVGKSAFIHEVGQWNLSKLGQWQSMGAILDKRKNKREKERRSERESMRLGEQNQAAYFVLALTLNY